MIQICNDLQHDFLFNKIHWYNNVYKGFFQFLKI